MSKSHSDTKRFPLAARLGTSASLITLIAMGAISPVHAQEEDESVIEEEIVVRGLRSSIQSAQDLKRNAANIQDSIIAEDIGKLPDRSVTEALQRLSGISVSRFDSPGDPEHFAGEGAGVTVRGLPQVRGELNGGEIFSADGGRGLSFDDVPAELMAGVDVYKSPTAEMVEGGLGGIVNLRTRMPFDSDDRNLSFTAKANYGDIIEETNYEFSGLYSDRWDTNIGELGLLLDFSTSDISSRADNLYVRAFFPRMPGGTGENAEIEPDRTVWVPRGADWRRNDYERSRQGKYIAIQLAPNDDLEFYLTGFQSDAERTWLENGFFIDAGGGFEAFLPVKGQDDWVYDANNALISGTITTASSVVEEGTGIPQNDNGVPFGTSTRLASNRSMTRDISYGFEWQASDQLKINADVQRVVSTSQTDDYTMGLVAFPEYIEVGGLNTTSGTPSIAVEPGFLSDPTNYSFGQMMVILADNDADANAFKVDAEYAFDDSVITSVKAGVRFTDKTATNRGGNNWSARYQPWQIGGASWQAFRSSDQFPTIQNEQFITEFTFDNFQRGDANVPTSAWLFDADYIKDIKDVSDFGELTDQIIAITPNGCCGPDLNAVDLESISNKNTQEETTEAVYVMLNFGFEDWAMPLYGNIGVRHIKTENVASGQLTFPTFTVQETDDEGNVIDEVQPFFAPDIPFDAENSYSNTLPSLNLSLQATDDVVLRFAAAEGIWRPEFWRLKALLNLSAEFRSDITPPDTIEEFTPDMVNFTLNSNGTNPYLEPMSSTQLDFSAEWYFNEDGGMVYAALFSKDVEDFFREETVVLTEDIGGFNSITSTLPVNTGTADIKGYEIGFTYFFDTLPEPFSGLGVQGNYTYIDSTTEVPLEVAPVDTDGSEYAELPLEGLSEDTYNLMLMYEDYGWNARLAYNWRSKQLLAVGPNGWNGNNIYPWRLPVYADDYGQLDFSIGYDFSDALSVHFDAYNIGQSETRVLFDQVGAGTHTGAVYSQDTRYSLSLRAHF